MESVLGKIPVNVNIKDKDNNPINYGADLIKLHSKGDLIWQK